MLLRPTSTFRRTIGVSHSNVKLSLCVTHVVASAKDALCMLSIFGYLFVFRFYKIILVDMMTVHTYVPLNLYHFMTLKSV